METVILTFDKKEIVKGNIFNNLNTLKDADEFARQRAKKINGAIFTRVNDLIFSYAEQIANKINIDGVEVSVSKVHSEIHINFHTNRYGVKERLAQTLLKPMYASSSQEKYSIYSEEFKITVRNNYTEKVGDTLATDSLEKVEKRILEDLKLALKI